MRRSRGKEARIPPESGRIPRSESLPTNGKASRRAPSPQPSPSEREREKTPPGSTAILVVGYGNELRGDDALGPGVADSVRNWDLPGVQVLKVHQLTPELSEAVAAAEAVIFVDAALAAEHAEVQVRSIGPSTETEACAHASNPWALLALAQALFGRSPPAWLVTIPAVNFVLGAPLSATAEQGRVIALDRLRELIGARSKGRATV